METDPAAEVDELCATYERKGIPTAPPHELAERIVHGDPGFALDTMAREEFGALSRLLEHGGLPL